MIRVISSLTASLLTSAIHPSTQLIHTFGAAFGLAVAVVLGDPAKRGVGNGESKLGTSRHNGTFAMIGT